MRCGQQKARSQLGLKFVTYLGNKYQASWFTEQRDLWLLTSKYPLRSPSMLIPKDEFKQLTTQIPMDVFNVMDYFDIEYSGQLTLNAQGETILRDMGNSPEENAQCFGSNAVALPDDAYVDLDIVHQLGSEEYVPPTIAARCTYVDTTGDVVVTVTSDGSADIFARADSIILLPNTKYILEINVTKLLSIDNSIAVFDDIAGTYIITKSDGIMSLGQNRFEFTTSANTDYRVWYNWSGTFPILGDTFEMNTPSIKEISTNNSYLTYTDPVTQEIETIASQDNASASSKELVTNGDFSDGDTGWIIPENWDTSSGSLIGINATLKPLQNITTPDKIFVFTHTASNLSGDTYTINLEAFGNVGQITIAETRKDIFTGVISSFDFRGWGGTGLSITIDNVSIKQVLPISTKYRMTNDFSNCFMTNVVVTQADRDLIKAHPNGVINMWLTDTNPLGFSFEKINIKHYYVASCGLR